MKYREFQTPVPAEGPLGRAAAVLDNTMALVGRGRGLVGGGLSVRGGCRSDTVLRHTGKGGGMLGRWGWRAVPIGQGARGWRVTWQLHQDRPACANRIRLWPCGCTRPVLQMSKGRAFTDNASVSITSLPGGKLLALSGEGAEGRGGEGRGEVDAQAYHTGR